MKPKLVRVTTVPISLEKLLEGQLKFMSNYFNVIAISSDNERLKKFGQHEGVATFCIEMTRKVTPLKDLLAIWKMFLFLRTERPFIIHTHTPKAGLVGMLAAYFSGVPNRLHTVAGLPLLEARGFKRFILELVDRIVYSCATKVYPNSFGLRDIIIQNNLCKSRKLEVIGSGSSNGIDTDYFNPEIFSHRNYLIRDEWDIGVNDFVFCFIGRLVGDKGVNELVLSFIQAFSERTNVKLILVGDFEADLDPLTKETLFLIQNSNSIVHTGYQSDVRPFLHISNAFVFPSYREGFPNVVLQALAMGIPAIVSDINGCNEIVQDAYNGVFVRPKNADELRAKLLELYYNVDFYNTMRANARVSVIDKFQRGKFWNATLQEYLKLGH